VRRLFGLCAESATRGVAHSDWEVAEEYLRELFANERLLREYPISIDPPHLARRVGTQRSYFTVFGTDLDGLEKLAGEALILWKVTVKASAIETIATDLETCGLTETTAFPDLEGLSRELNRELGRLWGTVFPPLQDHEAEPYSISEAIGVGEKGSPARVEPCLAACPLALSLRSLG
jgi:hypothetical protein